MARQNGERIKETSTTTGTGAFTLAGAATGFRAFSAVCANNDTILYWIVNGTTTEWERGVGTWGTGNILTRTTVLRSSNANAAVNFSAGTKDVFVGSAAADAEQYQIGASATASNNWVLDTDGVGSIRIGVGNAGSVTNKITYDGITLGLNNTTDNKILSLGSAPADNSAAIIKLLGSSTRSNWQIAHNTLNSGALDFMYSSAPGGSTFAASIMTMTTTGISVAGSISGTAVGNSIVASNAAGSIFGVQNTANNASDITYTSALGSSANTATASHFNGNTAGVTKIQLLGNGGLANISANNVALSDARTKDDIRPVDILNLWAKNKAMERVTFVFKDQTDAFRTLGMVAQQVQAVAPEFVADDAGLGPDEVPLKGLWETDIFHAQGAVLATAQERIEILEAEKASLVALLVSKGVITEDEAGAL